MFLNITFPIWVNKITIAIFIKLLATKIVANSLFGLVNDFWISWTELDLSSFFNCDLDNENRATSEPEISPEKISNTTNVKL